MATLSSHGRHLLHAGRLAQDGIHQPLRCGVRTELHGALSQASSVYPTPQTTQLHVFTSLHRNDVF